jgi:2-hydroxychromene-2-carboxylate isomerase
MLQPALDFWFEFASTYSYPAAMRIGALAKAAHVELRWRPFLLGPIFKQQGWDTSPFNLFPAKGRYMWRDLARICEAHGLPFRQPEPFPQWGLLPARVALIGLDADWGVEFVRAVYSAEFGEGRQISDSAVVADILKSLNVDSQAILAAAQSSETKTRLRKQIEEARRLDIFGAPTFITQDGELFWGNDRLEAALDWACARQTETSASIGSS